MRKKKLTLILCVSFFLFFVLGIFLIFAQEEHGPIEITSSDADLIIQGVNIKHFGVGFFHLDLNNDGVKDLAVVQGIPFGPWYRTNHKLFIFDGKRLKKETIINAYDAAIILKHRHSECDIYRSAVVGNEGFGVGDFNGDGCDDILVAYVYSTIVTPILILGSPDFFEKLNKRKKEKNFDAFADTKIITSASYDTIFADKGWMNIGLFDLNGDRKDDIILTNHYADYKHSKSLKIKDAGKVFIVLGKDKFPNMWEGIDLSKDADITIVGDTKKAMLGKDILAEKLSFNKEKRTNLFIKQPGKIFFIPNIEKLSGQHVISKISNVIYFNSWGNFFGFEDLNGDSHLDLIIATPFSNGYMPVKELDPVRYQKYKEDGLHPLLAVIFGREKPLDSGKYIDDLADVIVYSKSEKSTKGMSIEKIMDLDKDGQPDAIFKEIKSYGDVVLFHFVYNFTGRGKHLILEDAIDYSIRGYNGLEFLPWDEIKLNENEAPDFIYREPTAQGKPDTSGGKPKKECGKVYIIFDKIIKEEMLTNLKESADLIINGEQAKERFGKWYLTTDIDSDGLDDLIFLSYLRDYRKGSLKKNNRGAVYIFLGKSLSDYAKGK